MDLLVPKLSATMETATVLRWLKQAGERVRMGEPIVELETDKAALEVEAPGDGTLAVVAAEGAVLPIGALLATIAADGAAVPAPARVPASPLARRLARTYGVDLARITGSGPHGRRRKRDVLGAALPTPARAPVRVAAPAPAVPTPAPAASAPPPVRPVACDTVEPLSPMRRRIAEAVALSRRTIPAFALDRWVETRAIALARQTLGPEIEQASGIRLTLTDFLVQALADTLAALPRLLGRFAEADGGPVRVTPESIDIGLVVATEDGMTIPRLRDLRGQSLGAIAAQRQAAVQRARAGRLLAADAGPASITLSNLGRGGADRFEAIIEPGQSSIVAAGREQERVIARGGAIVITRGLTLTVSVDHRLIDGRAGAAFLGRLAERIERGPWTAG